MKCVLIGAGSRGMLYARWAYEHGVEIVAVAEVRPDRLQRAGEELQIPAGRLFSTAEALRTSPYGRCVYRCDNDVCDHMSVAMEFDTGATATFTLNGHSDRMYRQYHIMCTDGEIEADDRTNTLTIRRFPASGAAPEQVEVRHIATSDVGHGGSDLVMMEDFFLRGGAERSSITLSVESHLMALAAEESRVTGQVVSLEEFRKKALQSV